MYLFSYDFKKQIQTDNLNQVIGQDNNLLNAAALAAQEEATSYLLQKYDVSGELTDTDPLDITATYNAKQRIYLNASAYSATSAYSVGDLALQSGNVYKCTTAIASPGEAFNASHWALLGPQYQVWYVTLPQPEFNSQSIYAIGDQVFWRNKTYTALLATMEMDYESAIQNNVSNYNPNLNVFPDDPKRGAQYWGTGTPFSVAGSNFPAGWTQGDNRSQQLLTYLVDIALYHLHCRIAPMNIPEVRVARYQGMPNEIKLGENGAIYPPASALGWLQACMRGDVLPNLPLLQPVSGGRIRWNSNIKQSTSY